MKNAFNEKAPEILKEMLTDAFTDALTCDAMFEHQRNMYIGLAAAILYASPEKWSVEEAVVNAEKLFECMEDRYDEQMKLHFEHGPEEKEE